MWLIVCCMFRIGVWWKCFSISSVCNWAAYHIYLISSELAIDDVRRTVEHPQIITAAVFFCTFLLILQLAQLGVEQWASPSWDNHVRWKCTCKQGAAHRPQLSNPKRRLSNSKRWFKIIDCRQICHQIDSRANIRLTWTAMGGPALRWGFELNPTEDI